MCFVDSDRYSAGYGQEKNLHCAHQIFKKLFRWIKLNVHSPSCISVCNELIGRESDRSLPRAACVHCCPLSESGHAESNNDNNQEPSLYQPSCQQTFWCRHNFVVLVMASDGYGVLCRSCRLLWFAIWGVLCPSLRAWALASSALPDQPDLPVTHQLADPVRGWRLTSTPLSAGVKVGTHELQCLLSAVLSPPSWWRDGQWADWSPTGWLRDCAGSAQFSSGHARGDISARCVHRYHTALSQWNLCPASAAVVKEVLSYQLSIVMIALSSSLCCDVRLPAEMTSHSYNWASVVIRLCWEEINNFDGSPSDQTQIIILQSQDISCSCNQLYKPQLWLFIFTMAKLTLIEVHQEI